MLYLIYHDDFGSLQNQSPIFALGSPSNFLKFGTPPRASKIPALAFKSLDKAKQFCKKGNITPNVELYSYYEVPSNTIDTYVKIFDDVESAIKYECL